MPPNRPYLLVTTTFAVMLAAACGPMHAVPMNMRDPASRYDVLCQTWVNSNVAKLAQTWGTPSRVTSLPGGGQLYEWDTVGNTPVGPEEVDHLVELRRRSGNWCSTRFTTSPDGTLVTFAWNGHDSDTAIGCYAGLERDRTTGEWHVN